MPSTYLSLHYHIVFATKERRPLILPSWQVRFHEYLAGTVHGLGGYSQAVGGVSDHVHLLIGLKSTHCLADFMRELKKHSSAWVHNTVGSAAFAWQEGYSAFTVSATARGGVTKYIANQEAHHRKLTYREEFVMLLEKAGVPFDLKYIE